MNHKIKLYYLIVNILLLAAVALVLFTGCMGNYGGGSGGFEGTPPQCIRGDFNYDNTVDGQDLSLIGTMNMWQQTGRKPDITGCNSMDMNDDGRLDEQDILIVQEMIDG